MKDQQMPFNFIGVLSLSYSHQRVSALYVAFFRMIDLRTLISTSDTCLPTSPRRNSPWWAKTSSLWRLHDHTQTHPPRSDSCGRVISPPQRPVPDNTQHSQETDIHDPARIRTRNPSNRAAADQRFRQRVHWDRPRLLPCSGFVWPRLTQFLILATQSTTLNATLRNYFLVLSSKPRWCS